LRPATQIASDLVQCGIDGGAATAAECLVYFYQSAMQASACYTIKSLRARRFFAPLDKRVPLYNPFMNSRILNAADAALGSSNC
jgi:hypothetical protein